MIRCRQKIQGISFFLIGFLLFVIWLIGKGFLNGRFDSVQSLQAYITRFGIFGPLILILFQAAQVVIPVLPGFLGCGVGAILFGPLWGFLCNYIGICLGSMIAFYLARRFGLPLLQDVFPDGRYERWSVWASKSKSYSLLLFGIMVLPLFPDDIFCYLTGVSKMKGRRFAEIVFLGKPWCILAYSLGFSLLGKM